MVSYNPTSPDQSGGFDGINFDACRKIIEVIFSHQLKKLFVLTTRTAHWFIERGFSEEEVSALPLQKKSLYNYQRKSKVFVKSI